jgi:hypothetical protein
MLPAEQSYCGPNPAFFVDQGDVIYGDHHHIGKPNQSRLNKASPTLA